MNDSQVQATSTLQGTSDSGQCCMTEDFTPAVSYSRLVPDINGSQGNKKSRTRKHRHTNWESIICNGLYTKILEIESLGRKDTSTGKLEHKNSLK